MANNNTWMLLLGIGIGLVILLYRPSNYKNDEKWKITRDEEGNLIGIEVIRDAKHN